MSEEKQYDVLVTRDATESVRVRVTAGSPKEAEQKAIEQAKHEMVWELDEGNIVEPYVADPELIVESSQVRGTVAISIWFDPNRTNADEVADALTNILNQGIEADADHPEGSYLKELGDVRVGPVRDVGMVKYALYDVEDHQILDGTVYDDREVADDVREDTRSDTVIVVELMGFPEPDPDVELDEVDPEDEEE